MKTFMTRATARKLLTQNVELMRTCEPANLPRIAEATEMLRMDLALPARASVAERTSAAKARYRELHAEASPLLHFPLSERANALLAANAAARNTVLRYLGIDWQDSEAVVSFERQLGI